MTLGNSLPNLAGDLLRIHRAITRGLSVAVTSGTQFLVEGYPDAGIRLGHARYVHSLAIVLGAHHGGEDEIAFPALKARLPAAPYERLAADHQEIESSLDGVRQALGDAAGESSGLNLKVVVEGLRRVAKVWSPHIQLEEQHFAEAAIGAVMTADEQAQVSVSMAQHSQAHAVPPYLALPFVLFNLTVEDRAQMAEGLPRLVTEELVPREWKDQWAPMMPFLLD